MRTAAAILVLLAAVSCSRPVSVEKFMLAVDCAAAGQYEFALDMADTLVSYDISLYTRLDPGDGSIILSIPLTVTAASPSGKLYSESVWADISEPAASGHFNKDFILPYRSGVRPSEAGTWTLAVSVPPELDCLSGMGYILKRR